MLRNCLVTVISIQTSEESLKSRDGSEFSPQFVDHDIHSPLAHRHRNGILEEIRYILLLLLDIFVFPTLLIISVEKLAEHPRILS